MTAESFPLGSIRVWSGGPFQVHANAAAKRARRPRPAKQPVLVTRVNRGVMATALRLAGGDARRIRIISPTQVRVLDSRYPLAAQR